MAPSRGSTPTANTTNPSDDTAVQQQSSSALLAAKRNFNYLISPSAVPGSAQPRFRTRALLRTLRYISKFIFWRIVRWAKYAAVGALVAGIGATAFGSVVTGAAWIAAPPTIGVSVLASVVWGIGKYLARRAHRRWEKTGRDEGVKMREGAEDSPVRSEGAYGVDVGPRAMPW